MEVEIVKDPQTQLWRVLIPPFHPQCISVYPAFDLRILLGKLLSWDHTLSFAHQISSSAIGLPHLLFTQWLTGFQPHPHRPNPVKWTPNYNCYPLVIIPPSLPSPSFDPRTDSFNLAFPPGFLWLKAEHGSRIMMFSKVIHSCKGGPQCPTIDIASFSSVTLNKYI